uniref:Uncharacterized protein n=1 Tax=Salix viminalis TaxID=40686 RepID=A0A6N2LED4_SALVM
MEEERLRELREEKEDHRDGLLFISLNACTLTAVMFEHCKHGPKLNHPNLPATVPLGHAVSLSTI